MKNIDDSILLDTLFAFHQSMYKENRNGIWDKINVLNNVEFMNRFKRVSGEAVCICGKLVKEHTYSEKLAKLYSLYVVELCDGTLGKM